MQFDNQDDKFATLNRAYNTLFRPNCLSIGLVTPLESYPNSAVPTMQDHLQRAQLAQELGFSALWLRDIPFNVPSFGDAGQMYDPFVYLGYLAAKTSTIMLGVGSLILPLRHPLHVAKSAASVDALSDGRLILGIASGDRAQEYPALNLPYSNRGERFAQSYNYINEVYKDTPMFENEYGSPFGGIDMLPKPTASRVPMLITGASQQNPDWLAKNGDGWITYPREPLSQKRVIDSWRLKLQELGLQNKPVSQSLYIDLVKDPDAKTTPIHLGFSSGVKYLLLHLKALESVGVNHVVLNLRFNQANIEETLKIIAKEILPEFS